MTRVASRLCARFIREGQTHRKLPCRSSLPRFEQASWFYTDRGLSLELCIEPHDRLTDLILFLHAHRDSFASVQHRSMIPAPEGVSNFMQGGFGVAPSQIHRHLAWECNIRAAPFAGHIRESNIKMFGHLFLNLIDGNRIEPDAAGCNTHIPEFWFS